MTTLIIHTADGVTRREWTDGLPPTEIVRRWPGGRRVYRLRTAVVGRLGNLEATYQEAGVSKHRINVDGDDLEVAINRLSVTPMTDDERAAVDRLYDRLDEWRYPQPSADTRAEARGER